MSRSISDSDDGRIGGIESVSVKRRTYFSIYHIQTAATACQQLHDIERRFDSGTAHYSDDLERCHRGQVITSIFMSVAFLEATVNGLFADAKDCPDFLMGVKQQLSDEVTKNLATRWTPSFSKKEMLCKYQAALDSAYLARFDKGGEPYQSVKDLVTLRNHFVHFKAEWIVDDETHSVEARFANKFSQVSATLNPLLPNNNFFPDRLLGWRLADWAVKTSLAFTDEFFGRLGLKPQYSHVRHSLITSKQ